MGALNPCGIDMKALRAEIERDVSPPDAALMAALQRLRDISFTYSGSVRPDDVSLGEWSAAVSDVLHAYDAFMWHRADKR